MPEDHGNEFATAVGAGPAEDGLEMILDRVSGQVKLVSDKPGRQTLAHQAGDRSFAVGQSIGTMIIGAMSSATAASMITAT